MYKTHTMAQLHCGLWRRPLQWNQLRTWPWNSETWPVSETYALYLYIHWYWPQESIIFQNLHDLWNNVDVIKWQKILSQLNICEWMINNPSYTYWMNWCTKQELIAIIIIIIIKPTAVRIITIITIINQSSINHQWSSLSSTTTINFSTSMFFACPHLLRLDIFRMIHSCKVCCCLGCSSNLWSDTLVKMAVGVGSTYGHMSHVFCLIQKLYMINIDKSGRLYDEICLQYITSIWKTSTVNMHVTSWKVNAINEQKHYSISVSLAKNLNMMCKT